MTIAINDRDASKFEYRTAADWYVHPEPCSPSEWNATLKEIFGTDKSGDPLARIVWGGIAMKNGYLQNEDKSVAAKVIKYPANIPLVSITVGYYYTNDKNQRVVVTRSDLAPAGKIVLPITEYLQLGRLRWQVEYKYDLQTLIALQIVADPDSPRGRETYGKQKDGRFYTAPPNRDGEYVGLKEIQNAAGEYAEPDRGFFEGLRKALFENRHETEQSKADYISRRQEKEAENKRLKEEHKEDKITEILEDELISQEKQPKGLIYIGAK